MKRLPLVLFLLTFIAVGCDSGPEVIHWLAELEGQPGFEEVSGRLTATGQVHNTAMTISIAGATPGAIHPWRVRVGGCDANAPIFASHDDYPPLLPGPGGSDSRSVLIQLPLTSGTTYHVTVHESVENMATLVACGQLAPR